MTTRDYKWFKRQMEGRLPTYVLGSLEYYFDGEGRLVGRWDSFFLDGWVRG